MDRERFAVSRLHLKSGEILKNQIIEIDASGEISYQPLKEELPFTKWKGGDYYL